MMTLDKLAVKPSRQQEWMEIHAQICILATYMFVSG